MTASSSSTRSTRSPSREGGIGAGVSREGVQRDLLPLVEGTTVATKYGPVKTDHILFIASGAFHVAKPSDLLPELQGRLPIRVELRALEKDDFVRILTETEASLIKQYIALMETEGVDADVHRRRHRLARRHRRRPQRQRREHRRAPAADGDGTRARRDLVRRARPRRHRDHHRRRLCRKACRRSREEHRFVAIYPLSARRNCAGRQRYAAGTPGTLAGWKRLNRGRQVSVGSTHSLGLSTLAADHHLRGNIPGQPSVAAHEHAGIFGRHSLVLLRLLLRRRSSAHAATLVPPGNRSAEQPGVPAARPAHARRSRPPTRRNTARSTSC